MSLGTPSIPLEESPETASATPALKLRWRKQVVVGFLLFHLLLPLAFLPWLFSWVGVISVFLGNYIFCSVGIGLCYHRALCHQSLRLPKWLERSLAVLGVCSLQDSPCYWVALHRLHHKYSDEIADPHSPVKNFFWGHTGWVLFKRSDRPRGEVCRKYVPDLLRDPFYAGLEKHNAWGWVFIAHAILYFLIAFLIGLAWTDLMGGLQFGLSMFVWGVIVRVVYTWHITWAVNSICHMWGYRNYKTTDNSRNNWLIALATNGEGWHNNHHADQRSAAHGHRWWELDVTYLTIRFLKMLGLATAVVSPRPIQERDGSSEMRKLAA
ncbi:MAG: acyl-CoA desaturase [Gemmataceae bacterium]